VRLAERALAIDPQELARLQEHGDTELGRRRSATGHIDRLLATRLVGLRVKFPRLTIITSKRPLDELLESDLHDF
jgi:hypothetical protein